MESVVFVRVGWMELYRLSATGEPDPIGGGKYNLQGPGSERDNFLPDAFGRVRGYFAIGGTGDHAINLFRVDGTSRSKAIDQISGVLVIFVSKPPNQEDTKGPAIVGFYKKATLYRHQQKPSSESRAFRTEARTEDARLIPVEERMFHLPRATPLETGMGQSNIFYIREKDGTEKDLRWIQAAIDYVASCEQSTSPLGVADNVDPATAAEIDADRSAGLTSNAQIRKAVEMRAMEVVRASFSLLLKDTSKTKPYDYSYVDQGIERFIEVKGTQQSARGIILTRNEVAFARKHSPLMELCLVHSIAVDNKGPSPIATGGILVRFPNWNPDEHGLAAMQYQCHLDHTLGLTV